MTSWLEYLVVTLRCIVAVAFGTKLLTLAVPACEIPVELSGRLALTDAHVTAWVRLRSTWEPRGCIKGDRQRTGHPAALCVISRRGRARLPCTESMYTNLLRLRQLLWYPFIDARLTRQPHKSASLIRLFLLKRRRHPCFGLAWKQRSGVMLARHLSPQYEKEFATTRQVKYLSFLGRLSGVLCMPLSLLSWHQDADEVDSFRRAAMGDVDGASRDYAVVCLCLH